MAKSITIVAVTSLAPKSHWTAIERTAACIPHPCEKLLIVPSWKWTLADMCRFLMRDLHQRIETDIAIVVQLDGYAVNADKWDESFLNWDFVGAPWPKHFPFVRLNPTARVGNGGFSLRSKRWLDAASKLPEPPPRFTTAEDVYSILNREHFEKAGCSVAPLEVAMRWSMENRIGEFPTWQLNDSFGFHGLTAIDPARANLRLPLNE